jgi:integrase
MSIKARQVKKGRVYDVRLRGPDGREVSRTFLTKRDAEQYRAAQVTTKAKGMWIDPGGLLRSFGEVADEWLEANPAKRDSSRSRDSSALRNHILPLFANHKIGRLTPSDVRGAVRLWADEMKPRSVRRVYGALRAVLNYAVENDWLGRTPCRGIQLPAITRKETLFVRPEDAAALAAAMGPRFEAMAWIGVVTGLRWGEVAGLRVGDVDVLGRTIEVRAQVTRGKGGRAVVTPPKSEAGHRVLSIPGELADLLGAHVAARGLTGADASAFLFPSGAGGPLDYAGWRRRVWVPAAIAAGFHEQHSSRSGANRTVITLGFHDLRRANATAMVRDKVDIKTAQRRLGHSDPRLTLAVYAQATPEGDREAATRLGDRFMGDRGIKARGIAQPARGINAG